MYAQLYNPKTIEKKYSKISITTKQRKAANEWIKKLKNKELEKEVKNYFKFRDIILRDLLGYPEKKILYEEKNVEFSIQDEHGDTGVCFEAKGTKTKNLFVRQGYEKKEQEKPVDQTLSNMKRFPAAYGVCTNYSEFVLIDRKKKLSKCHRFNFLSIKDNDKKLKEFIGIFSYENLIIKKSLDELYNSSVSEEREFTKEFYKLFHETRLMLIKAFQEKEHVDMGEALHYAQLFLNRLIFVFFASDKGDIESRLFTNRILKILEAGKSSESSRLISDDILKLFKDLDKGTDIRGIFGFNGGLFQEQLPSKIYFFDLKDPEFFREVQQHSKLSKKVQLDELSSKIIKKYEGQLNPIISNFLIMDSFDFNSEINVNILGHVFEQSISYLEELKQEGISKRKKEGVFYTPEYITEYICYNTIIPYLSKQNVTTIHELIKEYFDNIEELEHRIQEIKILDPACGSGAFLIKAVEILLEIDKEIQSIKPNTGEQATLEEFSQAKEITRIIEQNIFGVDINEESIEITKLSLFLKMAAPNKKLTDLSKNIKVGNSLVSEKSVDDKAFNWELEFKDVMNSGKFDIILGNPPYLNIKGLRAGHEHLIKSLEENYVSATQRYDFYVLFIEKASKLLKKNGYLGYIVPHKFANAQFGKGIRKYLSENQLINTFVSFGHNFVFEETSTYTGILILKNLFNRKFRFAQIDKLKTKSLEEDLNSLKKDDFTLIDSKTLGAEPWILSSSQNMRIVEKIKNSGPNIMDYFEIILNGLQTEANTLYILTPVKDKGSTIILHSEKTGKDAEFEKEMVRPLLKGENVKKYIFFDSPPYYVIYPYVIKNGKQERIEEADLRRQFPLTYNYLSQFKDYLIELRTKFKTNPKYWHVLHRGRRMEWFEQEKIITPEITLGCNMTLDNTNYYFSETSYGFLKKSTTEENIKYFLAVLNSRLLWFYVKTTGNILRGGFFRFKTKYLESFCIPKPTKKIENDMVNRVDDLLQIHKESYSLTSKFLNRLKTNLQIEKIPSSIENFYELTFESFLSSLKSKSNTKLTLKQQDEWEDYFESYKKDLIELKTQSDKLDNEINQLVYKIYSLSDDEILIVDENYPKSV